MRVLSFETASYLGGVAYVGPEGRASAGPFSPRTASREVMAAARDLLERHGCALADLDLIAVSTGPGLFTGVRVGLSIAKTLAWAQREGGKTALVAVPTLEAVASLALRGIDAPQAGDCIAAITDARRGEVYAALFRVMEPGSGLRLRALGEDIVVRPERVAERLFETQACDEAPVWLIGDGVAHHGEAILAAFGDRGRVASFSDSDLAFCVADLGLERLAAGLDQAPMTVEPHYVRRPDARPPATQWFRPME